MEPGAGLSDDQALEELDSLFKLVETSLKEVAERPEEIPGAINASLMTLSFGITNIINRIRGTTPRILRQLQSHLKNIWTIINNLLSAMGTGKIKNWSVSAEIAVSPKFVFKVTFIPYEKRGHCNPRLDSPCQFTLELHRPFAGATGGRGGSSKPP